MIYFSADFHFYHNNILKYCNRPFKDVIEMNETIVANYNNKVTEQDTVWFLGDFSFTDKHRAKTLFNRLNGNKFLIKGNHDNKDICNLGWRGVWDLKSIEVEGNTIVLCHYPMRSWDKSFHGAYHAFGHCHNRLPPYGLSCDVGVDAWNYFPVSFPEFKAKMDSLNSVAE
jgi:calcineurin-like phosphoesterase family protein